MKQKQLVRMTALLAVAALAASSPTLADATAVDLAKRTTIVSASAPQHRVLTGNKLQLEGTVKPHAARKIQLQQRRGDRWVKVGITRSHADGTYRLSMLALATSRSTYRAYAPETSRFTSDTSRTTTITIRGRGNPKHRSYLDRHRARWNPCAPIRYRVNAVQAPAHWRTDVRGAIKRIAAQSGLHFIDKGTTRMVPDNNRRYPRRTDLVIAFIKPSQSSLLPSTSGNIGYGGGWYRQARNQAGRVIWEMYRGYVLINKTRIRYMAPGFGYGHKVGWQGTRGQALMHELGHSVGAGHAPGTKAAQIQVMAPMMSHKLAAWGAGDAVQLRKLGSGGCIRPYSSKTEGLTSPETQTYRVGLD